MDAKSVPRSRRSLLTAAAAAGGALTTQALVRPNPVSAANVVLGAINTAATATTIRSTQALNTAKGLIGQVTFTGPGGSTAGVQGQSNALHGNGVFGFAVAGNSKGVWGRSANGRGVYGEATGTSGLNYGVYGESKSSVGRGVYGVGYYGTHGVGSTYGAWGDGGVLGVVGLGDTTGVFANGGETGIVALGGTWAGLFEGDVRVEDNLSVGDNLSVSGSKMFLIDHPQDPANRTLAHACVEAPEMLNLYCGTITLDGRGRASVPLPRYFRALNRDYRYQLTSIGAPAPGLYVSREVEGNSFGIAGGIPGQKVSWQVFGARRDAWAKAHPLRVDRAKARKDRGRYLSPQVHGQPRSMAIHRPSGIEVPRSRRRRTGG